MPDSNSHAFSHCHISRSFYYLFRSESSEQRAIIQWIGSVWLSEAAKMSEQFPAYGSSEGDTEGEYEHRKSLSKDEIEVRLAIADYVIRRANGTADGRKIFDALIPRFEGRYPHHKVLAHCLTAPEYIDQEDTDFYESPPDQLQAPYKPTS